MNKLSYHPKDSNILLSGSQDAHMICFVSTEFMCKLRTSYLFIYFSVYRILDSDQLLISMLDQIVFEMYRYGWMVEWRDGLRMYEWMDDWMIGWMDGWVDGWMD